MIYIFEMIEPSRRKGFAYIHLSMLNLKFTTIKEHIYKRAIIAYGPESSFILVATFVSDKRTAKAKARCAFKVYTG